MIENFDVEEINKFIAAFDEHCVDGSDIGCDKCPFSSSPCGAIKGNKFRDFAKYLHDWVEYKNAKPLTEVQITYLEALKTLGLRYLAKDSDGEVYAYSVYPQKFFIADERGWKSTAPYINLSQQGEKSLTAFAALSKLCDWRDERALNIADSLAMKSIVLGEQKKER